MSSLRALVGNRMGAVWAFLVAVTALSFAVGGGHGAAGHEAATVAVVAVAFVKVRLVGLEFMELRSAPVPLRLLFEGWVVVTGAVLIGLYLSGV